MALLFSAEATRATSKNVRMHRRSGARAFSAAQPEAVTLGVYRASRRGTTPAGEADRKGTAS
jgi:hypothetical protein